MQSWAVAITPPQTEQRAAVSLKDAGFEIFFPRIKRKLRQRGKRVHRLDPLFPNYLFVFLSKGWEALFKHRHLSRPGLLMSGDGDHVAIVPTSAIAEIKSRCNGDGIFVPPKAPKFKTGDAVYISAGQLYGFGGLVEEVLRGERAVVTLRTLGKVNVNVSDLMAG